MKGKIKNVQIFSPIHQLGVVALKDKKRSLYLMVFLSRGGRHGCATNSSIWTANLSRCSWHGYEYDVNSVESTLDSHRQLLQFICPGFQRRGLNK